MLTDRITDERPQVNTARSYADMHLSTLIHIHEQMSRIVALNNTTLLHFLYQRVRGVTLMKE